jgi:hypothetical protein
MSVSQGAGNPSAFFMVFFQPITPETFGQKKLHRHIFRGLYAI